MDLQHLQLTIEYVLLNIYTHFFVKGYQRPQGGYPPQQGGYPQQQGGYPRQQGGYPRPQGYPQHGHGGGGTSDFTNII